MDESKGVHMDAKPVQLPELAAKAYGIWADRMLRNLPPSSRRGRIPVIAGGILDQIAAQSSSAGGRGRRITPEISVPLELVDGIVRQLQRLSALTPRKDASPTLEEVGWLIELALRRAARAPSARPASGHPGEALAPEPAPEEDGASVEPAVEEDGASVEPAVEEPPAAAEEQVEVPSTDLQPAAAEEQVEAPSAASEGNGLVEEEPEMVEVDAGSDVLVEPEAPDEEEPAAAGIQGAPNPIRVLLVDDDRRTLAMLEMALKGEHDIEVAGLASDVSKAIEVAGATHPDVAVVDVRMPRGGGPRVARGILALSAETRILAYSALDERRAVLSMLEAGAVGYLVKGGPQEEVAAAIRKAMMGERPMSGEVADEVMKALTERIRLEADDRDSRDELDRQIRRFLAGRDLRMAWQPIVQLYSRDVVGAEAVPRFGGAPKRTPEGWFREAWRLGFGPELEGTVLEAAAGRLEQLPEELFVAVNLSPGCLVEPGFLASMGHLPWERIVVEVTERSSVDDYAQLRAAAREIRQHGGRLAVDDAGAAFASLRHVAEIEPDLVKMDARVCRNIHIDARMHALATALISFARELGAEIVAEGIEHRGQLDALKDIGVEFGQGPFFTGVDDSKEVQVRVPRKRRARR
ncbi:MAG TPA: EAL domain-containing protein [Actinomycetota bacterium]